MNNNGSADDSHGSGFSPTQRQGCPRRTTPTQVPAERIRRTFFLTIILAGLLVAFAGVAPLCRAAEVDRVEVGEITGFGGEVKLEHPFAGAGSGLQIGGKIFVGDEIATSGNGTIEIIFGVNVRIRLAGASMLRVADRTVSTKTEDGYERVTSTTEVLLRKGELRARVRENLVTPTPLLITAANMRLLLPRADVILRRNDTGIEEKRRMFLAMGWGRGEINVKNQGEKAWNPDLTVQASAPGGLDLPEIPESTYVPHWQKINIEEAAGALRKLPFSVDGVAPSPGDVPRRDPQMDGA